MSRFLVRVMGVEPTDYPCSRCNAAPGEPCKTADERVKPNSWHKARFDLAEDEAFRLAHGRKR